MTREQRWLDLWLNKALTFEQIAEAAGTNMEGVIQACIRVEVANRFRPAPKPIDTDEIDHPERMEQEQA